MRKSNRIMIKVVAVLLILVLFTSTVVSGTLAKYVIQKDATTSVKFEQYGVVVKAWLDEDFKKALGIKNSDARIDLLASDDGVAVEFGNVLMHPGYDYSKAIHFEITGTSTRPINVNIYTDITLKYSSIFQTVAGSDNSKMLPIGFTFSYGTTDPQYIVKPWALADARVTDTNIEDAIVTGLSEVIDVTNYTNDTIHGECATKRDIAAGTPIVFHPKNAEGTVDNSVSINEFALGFHWPMDYNEHPTLSAEELGELEVQMVNNGQAKRNKKLTFKFTVKVEQAS